MNLEPGCVGQTPPAAIIGLGSPHGDDQLGWVAVDRLRPKLPPDVVAVKAAGGLALLNYLSGQEAVIVIDAAAPAGRPGTVRWLAWPCADLNPCRLWGTHGPGLVEALHLAQVLGSIPRDVALATVEAAQIVPRVPLSAAASRGLDFLVETILRHVSRSGGVRGIGSTNPAAESCSRAFAP
jgi:hydrogenase maturation protease